MTTTTMHLSFIHNIMPDCELVINRCKDYPFEYLISAYSDHGYPAIGWLTSANPGVSTIISRDLFHYYIHNALGSYLVAAGDEETMLRKLPISKHKL